MHRNMLAGLMATFVTLGSISAAYATCASYPYTLTNGTTADATQVMADLNCAALTDSPTFSGMITASNATFNGTITTTTGGQSNAFTVHSPAPNFAEIIINGGNQANVGSSILFQNQGTSTAAIGDYGGTVGGSSRNLLIWSQGSNEVEIVSGGSLSGGVHLANGATSWSSISDERLKNWMVRQRDYRGAITNLWVGDYDLFTTFAKKGAPRPMFGVRAQQAYSVLPANLRDMAVHSGVTSNDPWSVSSEPFAFLALWGVKDLYAQSNTQNRVVAAVHKDFDSLRAEIISLKAANRAEAIEIAELKAVQRELKRNIKIQTAIN